MNRCCPPAASELGLGCVTNTADPAQAALPVKVVLCICTVPTKYPLEQFTYMCSAYKGIQLEQFTAGWKVLCDYH